MQVKFKDGTVLIAGTVTRDVELSRVGDKNTALAKFGVAIGKREDTTTIFINCVAWRVLAESLADLKKGHSIAAIGKIEEREWNGKNFTDLVLEWACSPNIGSKGSSPPIAVAGERIVKGFTEQVDDEDFLPF